MMYVIPNAVKNDNEDSPFIGSGAKNPIEDPQRANASQFLLDLRGAQNDKAPGVS